MRGYAHLGGKVGDLPETEKAAKVIAQMNSTALINDILKPVKNVLQKHLLPRQAWIPAQQRHRESNILALDIVADWMTYAPKPTQEEKPNFLVTVGYLLLFASTRLEGLLVLLKWALHVVFEHWIRSVELGSQVFDDTSAPVFHLRV